MENSLIFLSRKSFCFVMTPPCTQYIGYTLVLNSNVEIEVIIVFSFISDFWGVICSISHFKPTITLRKMMKILLRRMKNTLPNGKDRKSWKLCEMKWIYQLRSCSDVILLREVGITLRLLCIDLFSHVVIIYFELYKLYPQYMSTIWIASSFV